MSIIEFDTSSFRTDLIPSDIIPGPISALINTNLPTVSTTVDSLLPKNVFNMLNTTGIDQIIPQASPTNSNSSLAPNGIVDQNGERLFTVRPRGGNIITNTNPAGSGATSGDGNRGTRSTLRVITQDTGALRAKSNTSVFSDIVIAGRNIERLLSTDPGIGFNNFLVTGVNVSLNEKVQITQTFGDADVIYYFGRTPPIFNISGVLIDDIDNQWFIQFIELYENVLRGTALAIDYNILELSLPNMKVIGSISAFTYNQDSARDTDIPFSMTFIAKNVIPLPVRVPSFMSGDVTNLLNITKATDFLGQTVSQINLIKEQLLPADLSRNFGFFPRFENSGSQPGNSASLDGFRSTLFSPIYGILGQITKIVSSSTGGISGIFSSFTAPVNTILRDIQNVSAQAVSVVKLIENSVNKVISIPLRTINNINSAILTLKNTTGIISRAPETIAQSISRLVKSGNLASSSAFLTKGGTTTSKRALLNSGAAYTPQSGAII